jgi:hypothetical protein
VKYCPNPECPHRERGSGPAEFLEGTSACNDCGMTLVPKDALDTEETRAMVAAFHADQRREVAARVDDGNASIEDAAPGRIHFIMAAVFLAAGISVFFIDGGKSRIAGAIIAFVFAGRRIAMALRERREANR